MSDEAVSAQRYVWFFDSFCRHTGAKVIVPYNQKTVNDGNAFCTVLANYASDDGVDALASGSEIQYAIKTGDKPVYIVARSVEIEKKRTGN